MKKIIALLLAIVMTFSLVACGESNKDDDIMKVPVPSKVTDWKGDETEPVATTEPEIKETEPAKPVEQPAKVEYKQPDVESLKGEVIDGRQDLWVKRLETDKDIVIGNSMVVESDVLGFSVLEGKDGSGYFSMSASAVIEDASATSKTGLYFTPEKELYCYVYATETTAEGTMSEEGWRKVETESEAEAEEVYNDTATTDSLGSESTIDPEYIVSTIYDVKYLKTVDGVDYISAKMTQLEADEETTNKNYEIDVDAVLQFEYEDKKYNYEHRRTNRATMYSGSMTDENGETHNVNCEIGDVKYPRVEVSTDCQYASIDGTIVPCTLVTDNLGTYKDLIIASHDADVIMTAVADTNALKGIYLTKSYVEFVECDELASYIGFHGNVTETMTKDDMAMSMMSPMLIVMAQAFASMGSGSITID